MCGYPKGYRPSEKTQAGARQQNNTMSTWVIKVNFYRPIGLAQVIDSVVGHPGQVQGVCTELGDAVPCPWTWAENNSCLCYIYMTALGCVVGKRVSSTLTGTLVLRLAGGGAWVGGQHWG